MSWNCPTCTRVNHEKSRQCVNCREARSMMEPEPNSEQLRKLTRIAELLSRQRGQGLTKAEADELRALQEEIEDEGRLSGRGPLVLSY
jgi:hypothetical protein